jgi:FtsZ-binding cell division protein ZapB
MSDATSFRDLVNLFTQEADMIDTLKKENSTLKKENSTLKKENSALKKENSTPKLTLESYRTIMERYDFTLKPIAADGCTRFGRHIKVKHDPYHKAPPFHFRQKRGDYKRENKHLLGVGESFTDMIWLSCSIEHKHFLDQANINYRVNDAHGRYGVHTFGTIFESDLIRLLDISRP